MSTAEIPATYAAVHRYDGAVLQHDRRSEVVPMAIHPRDVAIVLDVWRYKFLTATMIHELHWDGGSMWPAQRRLHKLFAAGLVERFRPVSLRGSYPWTYHLGEGGHVMLRDSRVVEVSYRHRPHVVHEFGYVLHDLQLNAWVLACRRHLGARLLEWEGERDIEPPRKTREEAGDPLMRGPGDTTVHGLADERERRVRPDAVLELDRGPGEMPLTLLIEFDRTRRVDKNFEKFRRYDTFLCWWWHRFPAALDGPAPYVMFICQDAEQLDDFLQAADHELTGHLSSWSCRIDRNDYLGRDHILFALEADAHQGRLQAWKVARFPRSHPDRMENLAPREIRIRTTL